MKTRMPENHIGPRLGLTYCPPLSQAASGNGVVSTQRPVRTRRKQPMHLAKLSKTRIFVAILFLVASAAAQEIRFEDFSSIQGLDLNGRTHQATWNGKQVLRLTDGLRLSSRTTASSVWFDMQQPLNVGFTNYFAFQVHNPAACCNPGDGLAFVIQNSSATDYCGSGAGKDRK